MNQQNNIISLGGKKVIYEEQNPSDPPVIDHRTPMRTCIRMSQVFKTQVRDIWALGLTLLANDSCYNRGDGQ